LRQCKEELDEKWDQMAMNLMDIKKKLNDLKED
jgi:hypothetical protein